MRLLVILVGLIAAGCQRSATSSEPDEPTDAYAKDIATVCNVVTLPELANLPPGEEILPIAQYLGSHIQTRQAREFLARTNALPNAPHAKALDEEARRVGVTECPLAERLRQLP